MNPVSESKKYLFRAYDVRGVFGTEIDPELLFNIGISVCNVVRKDLNRQPKLFVGFDVRQTSQMLTFAFISGAISTGAQVIFSENPYPFGVVLFSGLHEKADFTAFITASHLPPENNGVKFYYGDGVGFAEEKIAEIRDEYVRIVSSSPKQYVKWNEAVFVQKQVYFDEYVQFMENNFSLESSLEVIIDCGNGSASLSAPAVFEKCGYKTTLQWCDVDPTFPNRSPEPNEESLQMLSELVVSNKAKMGIAFDGDGDRAVIVDDVGRVIPADEIAIIIAQYLRDHFSATISDPLLLANISCSSAFEANLQDSFTIKRIKVGHTFLTLESRVNRSRTLLGVESSGHYVFPQYFLFDDAMLLPLIVGKIIEKENKPLSELLSNIHKMIAIRKTFNCPDATKFKVIENIIVDLKQKYSNINDIDGLAITLEGDGYVLIRGSNTEPKIRLFAEASTKERVEEIAGQFSTILEQAIKKEN